MDTLDKSGAKGSFALITFRRAIEFVAIKLERNDLLELLIDFEQLIFINRLVVNPTIDLERARTEGVVRDFDLIFQS